MKNRVLYCLLLIFGIVLILPGGCTKVKSVTMPSLSTTPLGTITSASVTSGGTITSDGGADISARGVCWATHYHPTLLDNISSDGSGTGTFLSRVTGLTGGTGYYVRAYATNSEGTAYGNEMFFITPLTDIDGNVYNIVIIGPQVWIGANLRTTKFRDNTDIPNITDNTTWGTLSTPAYCWYKNDEASYKNSYGALYNWFAVSTDKLCPAGWHIPGEKEWSDLSGYLGGEDVTGGILKETGTNHWQSPNLGATNDYGFSALPGGYRTGLAVGSCRAMGYLGFWWAATESEEIAAWGRQMTFDTEYLYSGTGLKKDGFSVRCVKDN